MTPISPKAYGAGVGAALSLIFWTIATATFWDGTFTETEVAALVGGTSLILSALLAFLLRDELRDIGAAAKDAGIVVENPEA